MDAYGIKIYKGEDSIVSVPFTDSGFTNFVAKFFTDDIAYITKYIDEFVQSGGCLTTEFQNTELDLLNDGVLRYTFTYKMGEIDIVKSTNTAYVIKTPLNYSARTATQIFNEGITSGVTAQKAKLTSATVSSNGTITRADGYSAVTVNIPSDFPAGYASGKTAGITEQKAKLISTAVTVNGTYSREDGYNSIEINVPTGHTQAEVDAAYANGRVVGLAEQKAKLTSLDITQNGTYNREDGYNTVTVNVDTGHTQEEINAAYASGYTSGTTDGIAQQKGLLASTAITANGSYSRENGWSAVTVNVPSNIQAQKIATIPTDFDYEDDYFEVSPNTGYSGVTLVRVDAEDFANSVKAAGVAEQKAKLVTTAFTANGNYYRENGYSTVSVNVPMPVLNMETKAYSLTANGTTNITVSPGYDAIGGGTIVVNVPQTGHTQEEINAAYSSGYTSGTTAQKAKLSAITINENGTYTREDGYSTITVNIPTTAGGYTYKSGHYIDCYTTNKMQFGANKKYVFDFNLNCLSASTTIYDSTDDVSLQHGGEGIKIYYGSNNKLSINVIYDSSHGFGEVGNFVHYNFMDADDLSKNYHIEITLLENSGITNVITDKKAYTFTDVLERQVYEVAEKIGVIGSDFDEVIVDRETNDALTLNYIKVVNLTNNQLSNYVVFKENNVMHDIITNTDIEKINGYEKNGSIVGLYI